MNSNGCSTTWFPSANIAVARVVAERKKDQRRLTDN